MALASLSLSAAAPESQAPTPKVVKPEDMKNVFQHGRFLVAGQPSLEMLRTLKAQGMSLIVNLRDEEEIKEHAATGFQEESLAKELGLSYLWIPLGGKGDYTPEAVDRFAQALKAHQGKVMIHCLVGGRASMFYMAYLVRHCGMSVNDALALGKQMKFSFYLENLLGQPISMTLKDGNKHPGA